MMILMEHGTIITVNPADDILTDGWILVENGHIVGIGTGDYDGRTEPNRLPYACVRLVVQGFDGRYGEWILQVGTSHGGCAHTRCNLHYEHAWHS